MTVQCAECGNTPQKGCVCSDGYRRPDLMPNEVPFLLIMQYEQGDLSAYDTLTLFGHLVATGMAWRLQGHYGRTAQALIDRGAITPEGLIATRFDMLDEAS